MSAAMNLSLTLPRDLSTVPLVRHILKYTLTEFRAQESDIHDVEVAVTEACANVVEHATGAGDEYRIEAELDGDRCEIRVIDTGHGFDHAMLGDQAADDSERGRGIRLMEALVDRIDFHSEPEQGTIVHLMKQLTFRGPLGPARTHW